MAERGKGIGVGHMGKNAGEKVLGKRHMRKGYRSNGTGAMAHGQGH